MLSIATRISDSTTYPVVSTQALTTEGTGLILTQEDGLQKVSNGTGSNDEVFIGVSVLEYTSVTHRTRVESVTVPAGGGSVTLARTPTGGSTSVRAVSSDGTINTATQAGAVTGTGDVQLAGQDVTFHSAEANMVFNITYRYALTVLEAQEFIGDGVAGSAASEIIEAITVVTKGFLQTDQFDTSADWSAGNIANIKVGAGGVFQIGGTGASVNGHVIDIPTADSPFLGIYINQ